MFSLSSVQAFFVTTESYVIKIIAAAKAEEVVAEHEIAVALGWVAKHIPQGVQALTEGVAILEGLGVSANPEVAVAIAAANAAVAGLNAFEAKYQAGTSNVATVANGYNAIKQAAAAVSAAVAAGSAAAVTAVK